jgi:uncharacterized protein YkwD
MMFASHKNAWMLHLCVALGLGMASGCDEPSEADIAADDELARGDNDRGDRSDDDDIEPRAAGSCEGAGGGKAEGCYCDSECAKFGDCCEDKVEVCDAPPDEEPETPEPVPETPPTAASDVPNNAYCADVASWPAAATAFENEVLVLVNQRRAAGATCPTYGAKPPVGALTMNGALRCAARKHNKDMITNKFFSHTGTGNTTPWARFASAGYGSYKAAGENIAAGQNTPAAVVAGWMNSAGHCKNIMDGAFKELGVGYAYDANSQYKHYWTQGFAAK